MAKRERRGTSQTLPKGRNNMQMLLSTPTPATTFSAIALLGCLAVAALAADTLPAELTETEVATIAEDAYMFGYQLVP